MKTAAPAVSGWVRALQLQGFESSVTRHRRIRSHFAHDSPGGVCYGGVRECNSCSVKGRIIQPSEEVIRDFLPRVVEYNT